MPQPSPVPAKAEIQATPATKKAEPKTPTTKAEPTPEATKSQPTPSPMEAAPTVPAPQAKAESTPIKTDVVSTTTAPPQIKKEKTPLPTTAEVTSETVEKKPLPTSTIKSVTAAVAPVQQADVTPKVEVPNADVPKTIAVEKQGVEIYDDVTQERTTDFPKIKIEAGVATASSIPMTDTIAAHAAVPGVVPETEIKPEVSAPEMIIKEAKPMKSLQQVEVPPKSAEQPISEVKPVTAADSRDLDFKKTTEVTSAPELQPVSTIVQVRITNVY